MKPTIQFGLIDWRLGLSTTGLATGIIFGKVSTRAFVKPLRIEALIDKIFLKIAKNFSKLVKNFSKIVKNALICQKI